VAPLAPSSCVARPASPPVLALLLPTLALTLLTLSPALNLAPQAATSEQLLTNAIVAVEPDGDGGVWLLSGEPQAGTSHLGLAVTAQSLQVVQVRSLRSEAGSPLPPLLPGNVRRGSQAGAARLRDSTLLVTPSWASASGDPVLHPDGLLLFDRTRPTQPPAKIPFDWQTDDREITPLDLQLRNDTLWMPLGVSGLAALPWARANTTGALSRWELDTATGTLASVQQCAAATTCTLPAASLAIHRMLPVAGSVGPHAGSTLYPQGSATGTRLAAPPRPGLEVTGLWPATAPSALNGTSDTLLVEWSPAAGDSASLLQLIPVAGGTPRAVILPEGRAGLWDSLGVRIHNAVLLGDTLWLAALELGEQRPGLLRLARGAILANVASPTGPEDLLVGREAGLLPDDARVPDVRLLDLDGTPVLVAATYGFGAAFSLDRGATWQRVAYQTPVGGDLAEIRCVPSVLRVSGQVSRFGYRLSRAGRVTIRVYAYDMELVRTVVSGAARAADPIRSNKLAEDLWDGLDDAGVPVASGVYYVKVSDDHGHEGWGKVYKVAGP